MSTRPVPSWAYALTIFLSAFLLFQVQPLISRHILPWFGGSTAVWSAAMLFFQAALLGGYAYAHWLAVKEGSPVRSRIHPGLLGVSALALVVGALAWGAPLLPDAAWKPAGASLPLVRILLVLAASIGLPYFTLSTTSPLLQAWFARAHPGRSPYALYALSNAGSFLALISYPLVFEPMLDLRTQAVLWAAGFGVYMVLVLWLLPRGEKPAGSPLAQISAQHTQQALDEDSASEPQAGRWVRFLWLLLPAISSVLLLAVTNQLTQEVAVIPFLWILPLSIYLLSYTLTFSGEGGYPRRVVITLLGVCLLLLVYAQVNAISLGIFAQILAYGAFLLLAAMALHGELYRLRPPASELTGFYLLSSLGSVLGGLFVNLAAPALFDGYWELPLGAALSWALAGGLLVLDTFKGRLPARPAAPAADGSPGDGPALQPPAQSAPRPAWIPRTLQWVRTGLVVLAVSGVLLYTGGRMLAQVRAILSGAVVSERNFYGVYRVRQIEAGQPPAPAYGLAHGITWHGFQFIDAERRATPTAYYGVNSGIGLAVTLFDPLQFRPPDKAALFAQGNAEQARLMDCPETAGDLPDGLNLGVIGLGTGTLAAYGRPGDRYRFYEINPGIIDLAEGKGGLFSFLGDSAAAVTVVAGDARVALEQELAAGQANRFDVLAVDAFSSDSIPIHLLTMEAFDVYLAHLQPQGVLAIHISNRYLDLQPLVGALAAAHGLQAVVVASPSEDTGTYAAVWVLATRSEEFLALKAVKDRSKPLEASPVPVRPWRDDYSNLVQFLRWDVVFRR